MFTGVAVVMTGLPLVFLVGIALALTAAAGARAVASSGGASARFRLCPTLAPTGPGWSVEIAARAVARFDGWSGRADRRFERSLPLALDALASSIRAGASFADAVAAIGASSTGSARLDDDLRALAHDLARGVRFDQAVLAWRDRRPQRGVELAVAALALGAETGGPRAHAVDGVAATLRERAAVDRQVRALSSQARASAVVIVAAPVAFGALGLLSSPGVGEFLFGTVAGAGCLLGGLALDLTGAAWMARLTRSAV